MSPAIPNAGSATGRADRRQLACHLLAEVEQVAEAEHVLACPRRPEPSHGVGRDPERACDGLIDALDDPAHAPLVDQRDEPGGLQALDVVVDRLGRLAHDAADLCAGARLGELAHDLHALGLQQRVRLRDVLDVQRVEHVQMQLYIKCL